MTAAARFDLALKLLALRAAELFTGFHLAITLDVSTLHAKGPPPTFVQASRRHALEDLAIPVTGLNRKQVASIHG